MMKTLSNARTIFAAAAFFALPMVAKADFFTKTNPVTGETENYTWKFVGTDTWNGTRYWQNSDSAAPVGVPAKSGDSSWGGSDDQWLPILFDGNTIQINAGMLVEGWNLRMGLYNGANITLQHLVKLQSGAPTWFTVDENSTLTIAGMDNNKLEGSNPLCLYSARANGITWTPALSNSAIGNGVQMPLHYYLAGDGTVAFNGGITLTSAQVIKRADVTLSEATSSKTVRSKTLVSFASSSTSTFTADATIKVKNDDGSALKDVNLTSVTATDTTLKTAGNVGDCELVQTSTGILLYYVDYAKTYKPSININFTNGAGNGLTTSADIGLGEYAIPGTSWNNLVANNNGSLSALTSVADSAGTTWTTAASVTISGTRGSYSCSSLTAASDLRHGYIDENGNNPTPTVTVSGIPFEKYRVVVYTATDTGGSSFGYITINGKNYTYVNDALTEGTTAWGNAGAQNSAEPIAEGTNVLVSPVTLGSTLTVVGHRGEGVRGCIAAIQIVEYVPEVTENDLVIPVMSASATYTVSEAKTYDTVYVVGNGTLTLDGSAKITAATIDVGPNVTMNVNADRLDADTFVGAGTVVYDGSQPVLGKGWTDPDNWIGTVWVKNIGSAPAGETANTAVTLGSDTTTAANNTINSWGNANSYVKFTNVRGHVAAADCPWTLVLEDGADTYAWYNNNGWTGRDITIAALEGDGTFYDQVNNGCRQNLTFTDASNFTGSFNISGKRVGLGGKNTADNNQAYRGTIEVVSGKIVTVASGKTWTTGMGFRVYGTINATGTLAADNAATACALGTGTVVFSGVPSPTGDAWWKNSAWTGTVEIQGVTALNGDYNFNDYGNSGSTLKLTNCSGWLKPNYTCVPAIEIGGTFTWNDGSSGLNNTFKVATLKGSGTIYIPNQGAPTAVWQITDDWSGFTGPVVGNNGAAKRILVFGPTLPATIAAGDIYISEGATLDLDNSSSAWWGVGMRFVVDGTVKASARNKWGGGTAMTLGDTGVLELASTANVNDASYGNNATSADLSGITGTGTLKYSSSAGWRAFPDVDSRMPASTLTIQTELADSLIITKNNGETVIGSLAGTKNIRSDFGANGDDGRTLTVTQSKDTEWQGKFVLNRITQFNVNPGASTTGTLTLSGTNTVSIPLTVSGSVNLTGTWAGDTTVSGTIGGTGTLTGNLTFNAGSIFKAFASDENGLSVSGSIAYPASGTVTVDVSALGTPEAKVVLLTAANESDIDLSKFVSDRKYELAKEGKTLVIVHKEFSLEQRAGGEPVKVAATDALLITLEGSGLSSTATASQVNDFLNAIDPNGLRRWENLATGTATNQPPLGTVSAETTSGNALSVKMVADTNGINKVDFGYTVLRELRKGEGETWTRVAGPSSDGTALDIGLLNDSGASMSAAGLYRVVTLLAYESVTNEIPSTNAIGIVEVASTATNTITAVPWKRLASAPGEASDLTVSNFVAYANLSAGDAVYMLDGRAYKMWKKKNDGTWEAATTVSGNGASISIKEAGAPDVATIPCGGAVWVQRADTTKPYFLVGQYDESAFSVMVPGSGAALIANPFPTNVTLNAIDWGKYTSVSKDTIRIRNPENGLYVELSYDSTKQKWGYYTPKTNGTSITGVEFNSYNATIPAGTGFIYDRKGGEGFTFEWK